MTWNWNDFARLIAVAMCDGLLAKLALLVAELNYEILWVKLDSTFLAE